MHYLISIALLLTSCQGSIKFHLAGDLSDIVDEVEEVVSHPSPNIAFTNGPSSPAKKEMPKNLTGPIGPI